MSLTMPALFWSHTATVYRPNASKRYATVHAAAVPCRLSILGPEESGIDPALGQPAYRLYYPTTVGGVAFALPEDCQVLVGDVRYNPRHGSERAPAPLGTVLFRAVDVVRAES